MGSEMCIRDSRGVSEGAAGAAAGHLPLPVHGRGGVRLEHRGPRAGQLPVGGSVSAE